MSIKEKKFKTYAINRTKTGLRRKKDSFRAVASESIRALRRALVYNAKRRAEDFHREDMPYSRLLSNDGSEDTLHP